MWPKKNTRIVAVLIATIIVLGCCAGIVLKTYKENKEFVNKNLDKTFNNEYTHEQRIEDLQEALNLKLISKHEKIQIYTNLSMLYSLNQEYSKMIETAVNAIYIADKEGEGYYSAWNYINLADAFMMLYDYKTAEALIEKALTYEMKNPEEKRWVKETAYIYMAELKSKMGKTQEARECLRISMNYIVKSAYDYEEMLLKRKIIWARTFWNEGKYENAKIILKDIIEVQAKDELIIANVKIPLKEMQAKLEVVDGNLKKSQQMCDEIIRLQQEQGYNADTLRFLKEIAPLFKERDVQAYNKYNLQTLDMYSVVMEQGNELRTDYIFSIYGNKYAKYQDKANSARFIMIVSIISMFIVTLIILLLQSRKQSITDSLTNTYNRRYFEKIYNRYLRRKEKFAVIMIDVDYFKAVNDTFGHDFGDTVLSRLCKNFNERKSKNSKLFRMGGEEFCVLYKCEKLENAIGLAEKLRLATQEMKWEKDRSVTISVGLAFTGQAEDLYNLADKNLYHSKNFGRNKVTYTP
ncbi:MAG: diguanylate cyclase [Aminipila sp.]